MFGRSFRDRPKRVRPGSGLNQRAFRRIVARRTADEGVSFFARTRDV